VAEAFIRQAKDHCLIRRAAITLCHLRETDLPLAALWPGIYEAYQRSLAYRGAVDLTISCGWRCWRSIPTKRTQAIAKALAVHPRRRSEDSSLLQGNGCCGCFRAARTGSAWATPNQAINYHVHDGYPRFSAVISWSKRALKAVNLNEAGAVCAADHRICNRLVQWTASDHPVDALHSAFYAQKFTPHAGRLARHPATN